MLILFVEYEFMAFGTCNVAVFRKCEYKPYAIVQFEVCCIAVIGLVTRANVS